MKKRIIELTTLSFLIIFITASFIFYRRADGLIREIIEPNVNPSVDIGHLISQYQSLYLKTFAIPLAFYLLAVIVLIVIINNRLFKSIKLMKNEILKITEGHLSVQLMRRVFLVTLVNVLI